jgi:hypothetical protein
MDSIVETWIRTMLLLDDSIYELCRNVTDAEITGIIIVRDDFHSDWNYIMLSS